MGKLTRCISQDGTVVMMAVDSTDIVNHAQEIYETSAVVSAALGRLLTGASLMGSSLKGKDNSVTVRLNGDGPCGTILAVSDSDGNVRGYSHENIIELPLNGKGKLDVSAAVGKNGTLTVIKDLGMKEPYIGQVPIISGEIAEDITSYFSVSEQIPTVCALGVLVDKDLSIKAAGGYIIQLLPTAFDDTIDLIEQCLETVEPISTLIEKGMTPEQVCKHVLSKFDLDVLDESEVSYKCYCDRARVEKTLISTGEKEMLEMAQDENTQVVCQFCNTKYNFSSKQIKNLIKQSKA
ncbi:MAG: Hsp33 family molecular chaperone HslO [Clostridia bacterium]